MTVLGNLIKEYQSTHSPRKHYYKHSLQLIIVTIVIVVDPYRILKPSVRVFDIQPCLPNTQGGTQHKLDRRVGSHSFLERLKENCGVYRPSILQLLLSGGEYPRRISV